MAALLPQFFPREPYLGPRRYRVVRMRPSIASADDTRVELQIVKKAVGLPDQLYIEVWPGVAGAVAEFQPGALVLVQFIDGDSEQPFISHVSTTDDPRWRPVSLRLDAESVILGEPGGPAAARVGDKCGTLMWEPTTFTMYYAASPTSLYIPVVVNPNSPTPPTTSTPLMLPGTDVDIATGSDKTVIE
jgi:hypothetical protein